jgi:hypothetical protein
MMDSGAGKGMNWAWIFSGPSASKYTIYSLFVWIFGFVARYLALPALAIYLLTQQLPGWAMGVGIVWIIYLLLRLISTPARRRLRKKYGELLQLLLDVYVPLEGSTISPRKLKETVDKAAAGGVVLDGAVFGLVDRMIQRDPAVFDPNN